MTQHAETRRRVPLTRDRVLTAAVELADRTGIAALSMRRLAHELDVAPMALYKHVADKEDLLDGMVDTIVCEIDLEPTGPVRADAGWKEEIRHRVLSARRALQRHHWARHAIESRTEPTPAVLDHLDSLIGAFRAGGLSADLTHHAMHAIGGRAWGFSATSAPHDEGSVVDGGCDEDFEFGFALDLLLDGIERLHRQGRASAPPGRH